ncbi:MAG: hypothetical protein KAX49_13855 [Halanaerobiales bacterium]|nr:hypothetical protein [Halanaerobiales bacterium]
MEAIALKLYVLNQIKNVRDWLDCAEEEYRSGQTWQGELDLNLAQAELKKAWEESQRLHREEQIVPFPVEQTQSRIEVKKSKNVFRTISQHRVGLVAGAVFLIILSLSSIYYQEFLPKTFVKLSGYSNGEIEIADVNLNVQAIASPKVEDSVPVHKPTTVRRLPNYHVNKDVAVINPLKEVRREVKDDQFPKIVLQVQPTLVSRKLKPLEKNRDRSLTQSMVKSSYSVRSTGFRDFDYDVNMLVDIAEKTLGITD